MDTPTDNQQSQPKMDQPAVANTNDQASPQQPVTPPVQGPSSAQVTPSAPDAPIMDTPFSLPVSQPPIEEKKEEFPSLKSDIETPEEALSGPTKESAPMAVKTEAPVADASVDSAQEVVMPTETAPDIAPELKEIGVEDTSGSEQPKVPQQQAPQDVTIELAKESTPVPSAPTGLVQIPMDEKYAEEVIKTHPVIDSIRWLAEFIREQVKKHADPVAKK